jgi:hypothetical protein
VGNRFHTAALRKRYFCTMNKLIVPILSILLAGIASCQKKVSEVAEDSIASDMPNSSVIDYKAPPSNTIVDAIAKSTSALNNRDSAAFWNSLTWENRDSVQSQASVRVTETLWDSMRGSHVDISVLRTRQFLQHVHRLEDTALFAQATIIMKITGSKQTRLDTLTAILRVDNGKWVLGSYSLDEMKMPFQVAM